MIVYEHDSDIRTSILSQYLKPNKVNTCLKKKKKIFWPSQIFLIFNYWKNYTNKNETKQNATNALIRKKHSNYYRAETDQQQKKIYFEYKT